MKITILFCLCLSAAVISQTEAVVDSSDWPYFLVRCFGYYYKRTNLQKTAAGAIYSMCSNYYTWFEAKKLNARRRAAETTIWYLKRLAGFAKVEMDKYKVKRKKRQAGQDPNLPQEPAFPGGQNQGFGGGAGADPGFGAGGNPGFGGDTGFGGGADQGFGGDPGFGGGADAGFTGGDPGFPGGDAGFPGGDPGFPGGGPGSHGPPTPPLPPGHKKRIRRELRMMPEKDRLLFFKAINSAKRNTTILPNKYDALAGFHSGITSMSAHGGCNFLGWHRMYLLMLENALREEGPEFADLYLPYWDSRIDQRMKNPLESAMFSYMLMGGCDGEVKTGIMQGGWDSSTGPLMRQCGADGPLMTDEMVYNVTRKWKLKDICGEDSDIDNDLEFQHNTVHRYIGGQMASLQSAVYDPIFWLHHCFIDLIWEMFRRNQKKHNVDPETDYPPNPTTMGVPELQMPDVEMGFGAVLVKDGLSNVFTDEWYDYAPPPSCTIAKQDCESIFLKCVVDRPRGKQRRARCVGRTVQEVLDAQKPPPEPCPVYTTPLPTTAAPTVAPTTGAPVPNITTPPPPIYPDGVVPKLSVIQPVQNTFCMNGKSDINQWVYLAVKIIFRRPPEYKTYGSYPVQGGKVQKRNGDIYSPSAYSNVYRHLRNVKTAAKYEDCIEPDIPTNTIYVSSVGLNYEGVYKEFAIVDRRLAVTVATAYIAVRKPMSSTDQTVALLHAQDKCGRVCKPICKVKGTEIFRPCSGAVKVTGGFPLQFGNSFGDAVLDVWDFNKDKNCPQLTTNNMVVSFYCDFKADWTWPKASAPPPTPGPPTKITSACSFGWGCIVRKSCEQISKCTNGEILPCMKSCSLFARCMNNQFYVHRCRRNEQFVQGKGCMRGRCDYRKSRREIKQLTKKLNIGTRGNKRGANRRQRGKR